MRRRTLIIGALAAAAALFALTALPAAANETGTVTAKVTVMAPCVAVSVIWPGGAPLDFGTRKFTTATQPGGVNLTAPVRITNCAAGAEDILVRGTDANSTSSTAHWELQATLATCSVGVDKYGLDTQVRDTAGNTVAGKDHAVVTKQNTPLASAFEPGDRDADIGLWMPCTGSGGAGETMSFDIVYTAAM
jgi:hypothetical protein